MRALVEVYEVERHMRYRDRPRWNWRLSLVGIRHACGPGFDTERKAVSAASRLCAALKDVRLSLPADREVAK